MALATRAAKPALVCCSTLILAALPARASVYSLSAGGTINFNSSGDTTIPVGTAWTFELRYDTAAPDLDYELIGAPDPTFGRFTSASSPPALTYFHYEAGSYQVTIDNPAGFGPSDILITFTSINAIDINISAPSLFPHLGGGPVSFHADFNAFTTAPALASDALPTNTALTAASFDQSTVTLIPPAGAVSGGVSSFGLAIVPEPWTSGLPMAGLFARLGARARNRAWPTPVRDGAGRFGDRRRPIPS